jgi:hypothetical protein
MHITTTLEYTYEPSTLFEEATSVVTELGILSLDSGSAVLTLITPTKPVPRELIAKATLSVRTALQARQMLTRRSFKLGGPNVTHHHDDGARDIVVIAETGVLKITGHAPDIRITGPNGEVIRDTKKERLERDKELLNLLVAKASTSATARRMLESFGQSIDDSPNELVHLYEIRDAAADHYGGDGKARTALTITKADWSLLGRLANDEPLHQGRHRGRRAEMLRSATEEELDHARRISRQILEAFAAAVEIAWPPANDRCT